MKLLSKGLGFAQVIVLLLVCMTVCDCAELKVTLLAPYSSSEVNLNISSSISMVAVALEDITNSGLLPGYTLK